MDLRPYQQELKTKTYVDWQNGHKNVLLILPTGGGKTVVLASIVHDENNATCVIAHRQELVGQISMALAKEGVMHKIIAPDKVIKNIIRRQQRKLGRDYYDPQSLIGVAGVKTLTSQKRQAGLSHWFNQVSLWVMDEAHHVLVKNHWGKAVALFPNAKGLGVTATPLRADNKGLGSCADGVFDSMCHGPNMRDLINDGYLCDYRIFAPPNDLDLSEVGIDATGDFKRQETKKAVLQSKVTGDVVEHYLKIAPGKRGITFTVDVETATLVANKFNAAGVPALALSAQTPDHIRNDAVERLERGELLQLVNCDLFGEGFDLPAVEVVSFARPTMSYGLYAQQFGRALRLAEGKEFALIIDHVGNVMRHGLPDMPREWTLQRPQKRKRRSAGNDATPVQTCPECTGVYSLLEHQCPFCGCIPEPATRNGPEFVNGDLTEISPEVLAQMRQEVERIDGPPQVPQNLPSYAQHAVKKNWRRRQDVQAVLRQSIAWWCGYYRAQGDDDKKIYKRFYFRFGLDVMSAQALNEKEADKLMTTLHRHMGELAVCKT